MTRRKWVAASAATLVLTGLAATVGLVDAGQARPGTPAGTAASTVKVGIIYSRTGLLADYGAEYIQGFRLGLRYATKGTNKVSGKRIEVKTVDDGTDATKAVSAAKDLIGQGYKILAGSVSTGVALQVAPLAEQNKILYISGPAAGDRITGLNRYTFRSGRQTLQDVLAIQGILGKKVGRKIVVFAQDTAFGQGNFTAVRDVLGGKGHVVTRILVPASATDFTPFARQAKEANADLLFVAWAGETSNAMFRALKQQGVTTSTKVATGLGNIATWPSYVPGINFLAHYAYNAPKNKVNTWLRTHIKGEPDLFTPDGFVAAQMIVRAIQKGGGENVDRMIRALEGWQFAAPKGVQRIRQSDHAMIQPMFAVTLKFKGKKISAKPLKTFAPKTVTPAATPFK